MKQVNFLQTLQKKYKSCFLLVPIHKLLFNYISKKRLGNNIMPIQSNYHIPYKQCKFISFHTYKKNKTSIKYYKPLHDLH